MEKTISITDLRNIQLDILDNVHDFCERNGLRYSLGGGTLLGAVRHKGYIPWDDDVDIMMPRPDYERFLNEFEGVSPHYIVQDYHKDDSYFKPFAKIYDNRTVLVEKLSKSGIYIDVFPIDGLPSEEELSNYICQYCYYVDMILKTTRKPINIYTIKDRLKVLIREKVGLKRRFAIESFEMFYKGYDFESSQWGGCITGRYLEKEHMNISVFRRYIKLPFENKQYYAIADYDSYLRKHYGDYMKMPPENQRVSNHCYRAWWK